MTPCKLKCVALLYGLITIIGCSSSIQPIPYLNNGQKWDKSILIKGDWDNDPNTSDTYLHWAPVNAGYEPSGEVGMSDDHRVGGLYQWGAGDIETNEAAKMRYYGKSEAIGWVRRDYLDDWWTGELWNNGKGPCPDGWRLPTTSEFKCLISGRNTAYGWTKMGDYGGCAPYRGAEFFGMNEDTTPGTGVFLPASGYTLTSSDYRGEYFGTIGQYWTSDVEDDGRMACAKTLRFQRDDIRLKSTILAEASSVRCVSDGAISTAPAKRVNEKVGKVKDKEAELFIRDMYDNQLFTDDNYLFENCTDKLIQKLTEDYDDNGEIYLAGWKFRSDFEEGPNDECRILDVKSLGDSWWRYDFLDMGNKASNIIRIVKINGKLLFDDVSTGDSIDNSL